MVDDAPGRREELLRRIQERVDAAAVGDADAVRAPEAVAEADDLLDLLRPDHLDMPILHVVGRLYWNRWAVTAGADRAAMGTAGFFLTPVYVEDPSAVPAELAEYLSTRTGPVEDGRPGQLLDLGVALTAIAVNLDRPVFYDQAVDVLTESAHAPGGHRPVSLATLGETLLRRHAAAGENADDGDLTRAVDACRQAERLAPGIDEVRYMLGNALVTLATRSAGSELVREAADVLRRCLAAGADDQAVELGIDVFRLSVARSETATGVDAAFKDAVVEAARRTVAASDPDDPLRLRRTCWLGMLLLLRDEAVEEAMRLLGTAVPGMPRGDQTRLVALGILASRLVQDGVSPLAGTAIGQAEVIVDEAAAVASPGDPDHEMVSYARAALRSALDRRAAADGSTEARMPDLAADGDDRVAELDLAIAQLQDLIARVRFDGSMLPTWLADLARLLILRWDARPEPAVIAEAIAVHRRLIALDGPVDPKIRMGLAELLWIDGSFDEALAVIDSVLADPRLDRASTATARQVRISVLTELDAEEAEAELRAVIAGGEAANDMADRWYDLAILLGRRHLRTGEGIVEAIAAARLAVDLSRDGPGRTAKRLAHLAQLLAVAGQFDEAVPMARRAVEECPPDHAAAPVVHSGLAMVLSSYHLMRGDEPNLDASIPMLRGLMSDTRVPRSAGRTGLSAALRARYNRTGDLETLDQAIVASRDAVSSRVTDEVSRVATGRDLLLALVERYRRVGDAAALVEAIELAREIVAATPPDRFVHSVYRAYLGDALMLEYQRTGDLATLQEWMRNEADTVRATPPPRRYRARWLSQLALSAERMAEFRDRQAQLTSAVRFARRAIDATNPDDQRRGERMLHLATLLIKLAHCELEGLLDTTAEAGRAAGQALADRQTWRAIRMAGRVFAGDRRARAAMRRLDEAARIAESAARLPSAQPSVALVAAALWGQDAARAGDWRRAAEAFMHGVGMLPRIVARNLRRVDAEYRLTDTYAIHVDAAACAIAAGDPAGAMTVLEQGRGVLLSYALDTRTELGELQIVAPELAAELERLRGELNAIDEPLAPDDELAVDRRHDLAAQWDAMLVTARNVPGFERFGAPPTVADLLPAAAEGPVVTINVSEYRCDALVVTAHGVDVIPLPELTAAQVESRATAFLEAIDLVGTGELVERMEAQATVRATLAWLWDVVAGPVLDALGYTTTPSGTEWPRVWWSPTGRLNFLPIHAAGHHDGSGRAALDRVVSSYTPTLRALSYARSRPPVADPELLVVAMPETPDLPPLPATAREAAALTLGRAGAVALDGTAARFDAVAAAIADHGWAHFACHAVSDPESPSASRLVLHDRALAVSDISRLRLRGAEMAFLSACSTARGHERLADEAIHIASAFQLAGYRHVVGTLWPVLDETAAGLAERFYARHHAGAGPAAAVHSAVRELRAQHPLLPSAWAAHVHAGP